jgi:NADP-dependent 3-hydroxy acid dehydrogenase YdfG
MPQSLAARGGSIVNVASMDGEFPMSRGEGY